MDRHYAIVETEFADFDGFYEDLGDVVFVEDAGEDFAKAQARADELNLQVFQRGIDMRPYLDFSGDTTVEVLRTVYDAWVLPLNNRWTVPADAPLGFYQELIKLLPNFFFRVKNKNAADYKTVIYRNPEEP